MYKELDTTEALSMHTPVLLKNWFSTAIYVSISWILNILPTDDFNDLHDTPSYMEGPYGI